MAGDTLAVVLSLVVWTLPTTATPRPNPPVVDAACPTIHIYVDVSGSALSPLQGRDSGRKSGFDQAVDAVRTSIAPDIDRWDARVVLYYFGGRIEQQGEFTSTLDLVRYLSKRPNTQDRTDVIEVWKHILRASEQSRADELQAFYVFSDFAHSSLITDTATRQADEKQVDMDESLAAWTRYIQYDEVAIRAAARRNVIRLFRMSAQEKDKGQQSRVLQELKKVWPSFGPATIDLSASEPNEMANLRPLEVAFDQDRDGLRVRNRSCQKIKVDVLTYKRGSEGDKDLDQDIVFESGDIKSLQLPPRQGTESGFVLRGRVYGNRGDLKTVSNEVSLGLQPEMLKAFAYLRRGRLNIRLTPLQNLVKPVSADVDVFLRSNSEPYDKGRVDIQADPELNNVDELDELDQAAIDELRRHPVIKLIVRHRDGGETVELSDVRVIILSDNLFSGRRVWIVAAVLLFIAHWISVKCHRSPALSWPSGWELTSTTILTLAPAWIAIEFPSWSINAVIRCGALLYGVCIARAVAQGFMPNRGSLHEMQGRSTPNGSVLHNDRCHYAIVTVSLCAGCLAFCGAVWAVRWSEVGTSAASRNQVEAMAEAPSVGP